MDLDPDHCYRALQARDRRFDGRFFTGVKTTGVYCRPICPARTPKPENIAFYPTAAAAQAAGFRPCLRCRPETSPDLGAWRGVSNTVSRALALIEEGGLDADGLTGLAERLGVGERQLRRLFRTHLGASPVAVAQTRRVLLAKQLIHDTRLPMAEIAFAAGFGSVRRFNEAFQQLYGRPPGALRRSSGAEVSGVREVVKLRLPYRPPYDWEAILSFLGGRAIPGVERVEGGAYVRTVGLDGAHGTIRVSRARGEDALLAEIRFPKLTALPAVIARIRRVFDLSADPAVIAAHLSADPRLAPLVAARPGLRVPGAWDGFELGVRAILGQQITVAAARSLAGRLANDYGTPVEPTEPGLDRVFPAPAQLAAADLSGLPMPRARSRSLEALARAFDADPRLFAPGRSLDAAVASLRTLDGIGDWTAQYIAMRQLREPDAFPAGDVALRKAAADPGGDRPTAAALLAIAEAWRPWRAYAALHLWASLTPDKETDHDSRAA